MYSWLVTVLLLASAAYCSGGQGAVGGDSWGEVCEGVCMFDGGICALSIIHWMKTKTCDFWCIQMLLQIVWQLVFVSPAGARVPITRYTCTQPNDLRFNDEDQCNVSRGLRTCETKEEQQPTLLHSDISTAGVYGWNSNTNPFVVLDIPRGWCVGSVKMTFLVTGAGIPTLSLSVHSAECLSNSTDRTMFSSRNVSEQHNIIAIVMNLTTIACGMYLRINMTLNHTVFLTEIEVFNTSKCCRRHRNLHETISIVANLS